jgi:hypothetical protein
MAIPFAGGNRLPASDLETLRSMINDARVPLINSNGTTATASVGPAEAVTLTFSAATFTAHSAFECEFQGLLRCTTANAVTVAFRDTNISGTSRGIVGAFPIAAGSVNYPYNFTFRWANTTSSDIVGRVLCVTLSTASGTCLINASAGTPFSFVVRKLGTDTDWSDAIAL